MNRFATARLLPLLVAAGWQDDPFAATPEGARVLQMERAALAHPALRAKVSIEEKRGDKVVGEKIYEVHLERPLRFRMTLQAPGSQEPGSNDMVESAVSNGRFVFRTSAGEKTYQALEATPFQC